MKFLNRLSVAFSGGAFFGLVSFLLLCLAFHYALFQYISVSFPLPALGSAGFFETLNIKVISGGLWGILFALPIMPKSNFGVRGLMIGLLPSLVTLFYVFPFVQSVGLLGKSYGSCMFLVVLVLNWIWAMGASLWYKQIAK